LGGAHVVRFIEDLPVFFGRVLAPITARGLQRLSCFFNLETRIGRKQVLKKGEVFGVWVWGIAVWVILAFVFGDFWWFRPLYRQLF